MGTGRQDVSRRQVAKLLGAGAALAALAGCTQASSVTTSSVPPSNPGPTTSPAPVESTAIPAAPEPVAAAEPATQAAPPQPFSALKTQHSLTDPASPWVIVNKHRPLSPLEFVPADLVQPHIALAVGGEAALLNRTTATAAEKMFAAAARDGVAMALASGYRSFSTQAATYGSYASSRGQSSADTASARPGYSEHQTGWSFDIADGGGACSFLPCFAEQPAAGWAKANAHKYGFVIRYPWMLHEITGYYYEPWHLRYIGVEAATDMVNKGIGTLEEYFGTGPAPSYP